MKSNHTKFAFCIVISLLLMSCSGRVRGPERVIVSGKVTWKGTPLPSGMIAFIPDAQSTAQRSGAQIKDGIFRVVNKGGIVPGTYRVEITSERLKAGVKNPDPDYPVMEQILPAKFNSSSTLTIDIHGGEKEMERDFSLEE